MSLIEADVCDVCAGLSDMCSDCKTKRIVQLEADCEDANRRALDMLKAAEEADKRIVELEEKMTEYQREILAEIMAVERERDELKAELDKERAK